MPGATWITGTYRTNFRCRTLGGQSADLPRRQRLLDAQHRGPGEQRRDEEAERQAKGESLTSADAIYGVDEDALRPEDFFDPDADGNAEDDE